MTPNRISEHAKELSPEPFRLALSLPKGVIRLTGGEPDFETPAFVREAAKKAIDDGLTHYTSAKGNDELRRAVADKLSRENGITRDYDSEIIITSGSSSGIFLALLALLNPGDEVLVPDPGWFHYATMIRLCGASAVALPIRIGQDAVLEMKEAERRITKRTKALIVNTPSNPTGMVLSKETISIIAELAEKHDLIVVSDEIYEKIVYSPNLHASPASLPTLKDRTITSNGFSKAYAMTGWRLGYVAGPSEIMEKIEALNGYTMVCPCSISQAAAHVALTDPRMVDAIKLMVDRFSERRKIVLDELTDLEGVRVYPPQGTFYVWIDVSKTKTSSEQFVYRLIESERVGVLPGKFFGERGEGHVRISYATGEDQLKKGLQGFRKFVVGLQKKD